MSTATVSKPNVIENEKFRDNLAAECKDLLQDRGEGNLRWRDLAAKLLRWVPEWTGKKLPQNDHEMIRVAVGNPDVGDALTTVADSFIVKSYVEAPRNSRGWVRQVPVQNFLSREAFSVDGGGRLERHPRGGTASDFEASLAKTDWGIARYSTRLVLDEQDLLADTVGVSVTLFEQVGRAARALVEDLIFSLILRNPTLSDSVALFHATHANYVTGGGSALAQATLAAARAAIAAHVLTDEEGDPATHLNLIGRTLLVPPQLEDTARRLAVITRLEDGRDFEVRAESRLSATGVVDPTTDEVREGTATNWMLAADATSWPCVLFGTLQNDATPSIDRFALDRGQWGLGWAVKLDVAAVAVAHQGLYFADGA